MNKILLPLAVMVMLVACTQKQTDSPRKDLLVHTEKQLTFALESLTAPMSANSKLVAPRTVEDSAIVLVPSRDWTSGFFAGELWMMYQLTKDTVWKQKAIQFTELLEQEKNNGKTHDMGFKMFCSYGRGYEMTKNPHYREVLLQSARTLITRYNPQVGCIRSWNHNTDKWDFPVIIDNMMNLELLFWASRETCDSTFRDIAVSHALKTMENHFRPDMSSYHVVDYDPETGEVEGRTTHQGYAPESAWSRGQAWALYGYTMVYRETNDVRFLQQAEKIARYIIDHPRLPADKVAYWDFDAPEIPNEPRDASAAAIMASALYELAEYTNSREVYLKTANDMFESLASAAYLAAPTTNFGFLLKHSTGSKAHESEVDVPLVYADYYFLESLIRKYNACF